MRRGPDPTAGASAGSRRMIVAPARAPRAGYGINDLDRDVLLRVLSCLDARQAVQTCLLSQLWRDLWRDMRRINASRRVFEIGNDGDYDARSRPFERFVNRLLMLRKPVPLEEFRLSYWIRAQIKGDRKEANLWIGHALLCDARSVVVNINVWGDKLDIDPAVFTSEELRSLLFCSVNLTPGFFRQLQTGCKALERLMLHDCPINDVEIFSQSLKFLSIGKDCLFQSYDKTQASISAPNLIHFRFFHHAPYDRIPLLKNMESLVTAYITLIGFKYKKDTLFDDTLVDDPLVDDTLVDDICQFLLALSGVTKLDLYIGQPEASLLYKEYLVQLVKGNNLLWCPKFNNLKFLTLGEWCLDTNFHGLGLFLQNSPNLEQLTLKLKQHVEEPEALTSKQGNRSFTCKHPMTVEIICWERDPVLARLKEFLLERGITPGQIHIKH